MSSPNNTNLIAQGNASAINGTADPAANANAVARVPAFDAAAGSDGPLDTSEAVDNNEPKQPFQDAFLVALKTAVRGANRFVYKDHSANHPEVRLLCSVVEDLPGQFGAGVDEVPEAMDDISKHIVQSLRDGAFSIQEIFPLQPGEVEPQPKKDERKFPLWPAMVHKSFNIQDVSQRYVPVSAMPNVDPALPYAFHIDRNGVEMPIDFPFELSFEPNSKKHDSTCVVFDAEEVFVPAAAAVASPEVVMEEVVATRGAGDADDAAPRRDTRLATGGKGKGTSGKGKSTVGKDNGSGGKDKGKGKARAEPEPASDSELSDLTESEADELSSLSELTESEDEEPAPKPAGRHARKPAAKPTKAASKATKATAPKTTKAAAPKTTKAGASKETKASAPRTTRAAAPRLVKAGPKKTAEPVPKGKPTKGKEPAAAPRATRGATTSRLTQPTAASKAKVTAAATKAAGASKAKAAAPRATKTAAASKPTAAPRAPSRAAAGKRKRDDDDDDAAPVAQRRNAAAARVSPPAVPAVRAQAGHNLRRTKAVSYKV